MTAHDLRLRLASLLDERIDAAQAGLAAHGAYRRDLDADVAACRAAYVGLAVTEIATLRAELGDACFG